MLTSLSASRSLSKRAFFMPSISQIYPSGPRRITYLALPDRCRAPWRWPRPFHLAHPSRVFRGLVAFFMPGLLCPAPLRYLGFLNSTPSSLASANLKWIGASTKAITLEGRPDGSPLQQLQALRFAWLFPHAGRRTLSAVRSLQSRAPNRWRRKWSYGGPVMPRRKITAGERSLLRRVFEETLPYAKLDVATNDHNIGGKTNSITPEDVPYLSTEIRCEDFDGPSVLKSYQGTFIHEFVHVWQHYHGVHKLLGAAWQYVRHGGDYDEAY